MYNITARGGDISDLHKYLHVSCPCLAVCKDHRDINNGSKSEFMCDSIGIDQPLVGEMLHISVSPLTLWFLLLQLSVPPFVSAGDPTPFINMPTP